MLFFSFFSERLKNQNQNKEKAIWKKQQQKKNPQNPWKKPFPSPPLPTTTTTKPPTNIPPPPPLKKSQNNNKTDKNRTLEKYYPFFCAFPSYISGVHHFWVRFLRMWPFFNLTIKVVTFRLRGWCVLGVFLLLAFTYLGHERQDLLWWNACVNRLDLGLYSHQKEFFWEWSLNPC